MEGNAVIQSNIGGIWSKMRSANTITFISASTNATEMVHHSLESQK